MEIAKAKEQVIKAGIELSESGLIARTWGNVSCRTGADEFVITASGRDYMTLTQKEVIPVRITDLSYSGEIKPSSEMKVHKEIYKLRANAEFVIHTHQSNASAVAAMGFDEIRLDKEYPGIGDRIICAGYGLPGSKKLCRNTAAAVRASKGNAVIMSNHGAVCYGRDYDEAFEVAHTLEEACGRYLENIGVEPWKQSVKLVEPWKQTVQNIESNEKSVHASKLWNDSPVIMKYMEIRDSLKPYLDDFAQLIGPQLDVISDDEKKISRAVSQNKPLLVRGKGALCVAEKEEDIEAVSMVIEKNCRAALAALRVKPISPLESRYMRQMYLRKYSKLKK